MAKRKQRRKPRQHPTKAGKESAPPTKPGTKAEPGRGSSENSHSATDRDDTQGTIPYQITEGGIFRFKPGQEGQFVRIRLTNFTARIAEDVMLDDGAERQCFVEIEATLPMPVESGLPDRKCRFSVPASQFAGMNWVIEKLGPRAVIYPGFSRKEHARTAIQMLSDPVQRTIYTHTGWRQVKEAWIYLHRGKGGAVGQGGQTVEVHLPETLKQMELPSVLGVMQLPEAAAKAGPCIEHEGQLREVVRASLNLLNVASDHVMVPILAAIYRAPLGGCDLSLHLTGPTGTGKSEVAALAQQHYGAGFDARHLPGSWSSTANALEVLAFTAKDMVLVIDDFCPRGTQANIARMHQKADRVLRGQGNRSGRGRLRADSSLRPPKPPRGLILSTGEDTPRGQSLQARLLIIEVGPDDVDFDDGKSRNALSQSQADAANGKLARAMSSYLGWLAGGYEEIQKHLRSQITELRQEATQLGQHKRTPEIMANLGVGLKCFLLFAEYVGAVKPDERSALWNRCWEALGEIAEAQSGHLAASEPTARFRELLSSGIRRINPVVKTGEGGTWLVKD